jgi:hypothetical protein
MPRRAFFLAKEIVVIIQELPSKKKPASDGLNGDFIKKMLAHGSSGFL